MKKSLADIKTAVLHSPSSIFTKEDVLGLLVSIDCDSASTHKFSQGFIDNISTLVGRAIDEAVSKLEAGDVIDFDSVELEMHANEVSLCEVDVTRGNIAEIIQDRVSQSIESFFEDALILP